MKKYICIKREHQSVINIPLMLTVLILVIWKSMTLKFHNIWKAC